MFSSADYKRRLNVGRGKRRKLRVNSVISLKLGLISHLATLGIAHLVQNLETTGVSSSKPDSIPLI